MGWDRYIRKRNDSVTSAQRPEPYQVKFTSLSRISREQQVNRCRLGKDFLFGYTRTPTFKFEFIPRDIDNNHRIRSTYLRFKIIFIRGTIGFPFQSQQEIH